MLYSSNNCILGTPDGCWCNSAEHLVSDRMGRSTNPVLSVWPRRINIGFIVLHVWVRHSALELSIWASYQCLSQTRRSDNNVLYFLWVVMYTHTHTHTTYKNLSNNSRLAKGVNVRGWSSCSGTGSKRTMACTWCQGSGSGSGNLTLLHSADEHLGQTHSGSKSTLVLHIWPTIAALADA